MKHNSDSGSDYDSDSDSNLDEISTENNVKIGNSIINPFTIISCIVSFLFLIFGGYLLWSAYNAGSFTDLIINKSGQVASEAFSFAIKVPIKNFTNNAIKKFDNFK